MQINKLPEFVPDWHVQKYENEYFLYSLAGNKEDPEIVLNVISYSHGYDVIRVGYVWSMDFFADFISSCKISGYDGKTVLDDWILARIQSMF